MLRLGRLAFNNSWLRQAASASVSPVLELGWLYFRRFVPGMRAKFASVSSGLPPTASTSPTDSRTARATLSGCTVINSALPSSRGTF